MFLCFILYYMVCFILFHLYFQFYMYKISLGVVRAHQRSWWREDEAGGGSTHNQAGHEATKLVGVGLRELKESGGSLSYLGQPGTPEDITEPYVVGRKT
jgi:hypothetical protein